MTPFTQNRPAWLRHLLRDLFVLVLAEALVLGVSWALSRRGRRVLARVLRSQRSPTSAEPTTSNPITP